MQCLLLHANTTSLPNIEEELYLPAKPFLARKSGSKSSKKLVRHIPYI